MSQNDEILMYLQKGNTLTALEALEKIKQTLLRHR